MAVNRQSPTSAVIGIAPWRSNRSLIADDRPMTATFVCLERVIWPEILQMNRKPASMFAFSGLLARQTRGADRYQHLG
jgi:hypothetical protein